jgi:hypothetical protein
LPRRRLVLAAVLLLLTAGCGGPSGRGEPAVQGPGWRCALGTGTRTDVDGLMERVDLPERPSAATWAVVPMTVQGDREVPGPTDTRLTAVLTYPGDTATAAFAPAGKGTAQVAACLEGVPDAVGTRLGPPGADGWREAGGAGFQTTDGAAGVVLDEGRHVVVTVLRG